MNKTKIEWTDYTWNPIKGICPVGCWYCYGRRIYQRFKLNPKMHFELHDPIAIDKLHRKNIPDGSKVFVCSTFELFHPKVPKSWRKIIFDVVKLNPKITFQILTKFPQNIDRPMPDNVWLGVTITMGVDLWRIKELMAHKAVIRFVSYEPFLQDMPNHCLEKMDEQIDWLIVGKLTGHGKRCNPSCKSLVDLVGYAKRFNVPIFLKDNLKDIWGEPLIREMPE